MIPKCEQDPPSIPDVLGWRLCRGARLGRPWDFSWGQTPRGGCGCDRKSQHFPGPGRRCSSIPARQNLSCPCPGWDTSAHGLGWAWLWLHNHQDAALRRRRVILLAVVRHIPGCRGYFAVSQHAWVLFCRNFSWPGLAPLLDPSPLLPCQDSWRQEGSQSQRGQTFPLSREPLRSTHHAGFALPPQH